MKRCPECNRTYADETISFCLADGNLLSAPYDHHATLALPTDLSPSVNSPVEITSPQRSMTGAGEIIIYLNNCNRRQHERIFGKGAFYDLYTVGYQATKAMDLKAGQQCVVATMAGEGCVTFNWYSFSHEMVQPDDTGAPCRVLYGKLIQSETLSKKDAAREERYSAFFDRNGNFKRHSVIQR